MSRRGRLVTIVAVALVTAGCSTAPLPGTVKPSPSPTAIATFTPVDALPFGTIIADAGVDFDSPDGAIHCGILGFGDGRQFFGCAVDDATYGEPAGTSAGCGGGFRADVGGSPEVLCDDTMFAGQTPDRYPDVQTLRIGSSITSLGVTCFSGDDGIACRTDTTGAGFRVSPDSFEVF